MKRIPLRQKREQRRRKAAALFRRKVPQVTIAKQLRVSEAAVSLWHATWKKRGMRGLRSAGPPGCPSKLTAKKRKRFKRAILKGPLHFGYKTDYWTLPRLAAVLKKVTGVQFSDVWTRHIVRNLGFSPQRPRIRIVRRNEAAIETWKKRRLPELKKMGGRAWIFAWI